MRIDSGTNIMANTREVKILNKLGLHARASAKLTQLASRYRQRGLAIAGQS